VAAPVGFAEEMPSELPAFSMGASDAPVDAPLWDGPITREWAWGGSDGAGVSVAIVDSGVDGGHPDVGGVDEAVVVVAADDGSPVAEVDREPDVSGHGTACAGLIRSLAPGCRLTSVRVLGADETGTGRDLVAGLRWALESRCEVVNLSLATTRPEFMIALHELADEAYFNSKILVASAHNMPVESWPWRFSSVVSVGSHDRPDPFEFHYNPRPPVEFFARGADIDVAWPGGGHIRVTGNSFATPHVSGLCALILAKHPTLRPFQVKSVLHATASNVVGR
jgi:subtilisin family serine protease